MFISALHSWLINSSMKIIAKTDSDLLFDNTFLQFQVKASKSHCGVFLYRHNNPKNFSNHSLEKFWQLFEKENLGVVPNFFIQTLLFLKISIAFWFSKNVVFRSSAILLEDPKFSSSKNTFFNQKLRIKFSCF